MTIPPIFKIARAPTPKRCWCPICEAIIDNGGCPLTNPPPQGYRCETCRHWTSTSKFVGLEEWGWCARTGAETDNGAIVRKDVASAAFADPADRDGDESVMRCKPDFGCVQWEAKQ